MGEIDKTKACKRCSVRTTQMRDEDIEHAECDGEHRREIAGYGLRNVIARTRLPAWLKVADGPKPAT